MKKAVIIVVILAVLGVGAYYYNSRLGSLDDSTAQNQAPTTDSNSPTGGASPQAVAAISKYQYTEAYSSDKYGFSFKYPVKFSVNPMSASGSDAFLVQDIPDKIGVQIVITPQTGNISLSESFLRANLPNLKIGDSKEVKLADGSTAISFSSDNPAFPGGSREIWFMHGGYLYQLSTYATQGDFLDGLFATLSFAK